MLMFPWQFFIVLIVRKNYVILIFYDQLFANQTSKWPLFCHKWSLTMSLQWELDFYFCLLS